MSFRSASFPGSSFALVLASLLLACASSPDPERASDSLRELPAGSVVGFDNEYGGHAWLGIPYAAAPVGERRWREPAPAPRWSGTRQAFETGEACLQYASVFSGEDADANGTLMGSEDCLYLDVYAPRMSADAVPSGRAGLPVMFWIHGGGNVIGRAGFYDGGNLAQSRDVVVVAINYRLGPFGWFRHEALRSSSESQAERSGNFATLDMIRALEWVRENISVFGGDPGNVTIFGESAGGSDVFGLMLSPLAEGLFHRAIMQSAGMAIHDPDYVEASADAPGESHVNSSGEVLLRLLADEPGAADRAAAAARLSAMAPGEIAAYLRSRSPEQLLAAYTTEEVEGMIDVPTLFRDGYVLPAADPNEVIERGEYNRVPVLMGTNRDENKLFMVYDPELVSWWLGAIPRARDKDVYQALAEHSANAWKARSVDQLASLMRSVQGDSVYAYRWDWDEEPGVWLLYDGGEMIGAAHGLEIAFVFGHFDLGPESSRLFNRGNQQGRFVLSEQMMSYWAEFAYSGDPGRGRGGDLPTWRAWDDENRRSAKYLVLDTNAGGGLRMETQVYSVPGVVSAVLSDARLGETRDKCSALRNFTNWSYIDHDEYASVGDGLCARYALDQYPWSEVDP